MASVNDSKKSGAERAVEAQTPVNGPRSSRGKKAAQKEKTGMEEPAFKVTVTPNDPEKPKSYYKPEEVRAKARALLNSGRLSGDQKKVLSDILGPESTDMPPKPARTVEAEKSIRENKEKSRKLDKEV